MFCWPNSRVSSELLVIYLPFFPKKQLLNTDHVTSSLFWSPPKPQYFKKGRENTKNPKDKHGREQILKAAVYEQMTKYTKKTWMYYQWWGSLRLKPQNCPQRLSNPHTFRNVKRTKRLLGSLFDKQLNPQIHSVLLDNLTPPGKNWRLCEVGKRWWSLDSIGIQWWK